MRAFRFFLLIVFIGVLVYTVMVGNRYGWNLLAVFFGDLAKLNWPGQFNLDFMCHLMLSGLWIAWRHHFSPKGLLLGLLGLFGGILVLAPYLYVASIQAKGDINELFLGKLRANN